MLDLIDDKALTVIFANIEDILLTATSFLSSLEQRQKSCRLYIDVVGDILEEHIPRMRVYMVSLTLFILFVPFPHVALTTNRPVTTSLHYTETRRGSGL